MISDNLVIGLLAGSFVLNFIAFSAMMKMNRNIMKLCSTMLKLNDVLKMQEELCYNRHEGNSEEVERLMEKIFEKGPK